MEACEYPVGLYQLSGTSANTLFAMIEDVLLRLQVPLGSCRGKLEILKDYKPVHRFLC